MEQDADLPSLSSCMGEFRSAVSRLRQYASGAGSSQVASEQVACVHAMLAALHEAATSKATGWVVHPALAADFERGLQALQNLQQQRQKRLQHQQQHASGSSRPDQHNDDTDGSGSDNGHDADYDGDYDGGYNGGSFGRGSPEGGPRYMMGGSSGRRGMVGALGGGSRSSDLNEPLQAAQQALALCVVHYCESLRAELAKLQARVDQVDQAEEALAAMASERSEMQAEQTRMKAEIEELAAMLDLYQQALQEATSYEADVAAMAAQAGLDVWGSTGIPNPLTPMEYDDYFHEVGMGDGGASGDAIAMQQPSAGSQDVHAMGASTAQSSEGAQGMDPAAVSVQVGVQGPQDSHGADSGFDSSPRSGGASPNISNTSTPGASSTVDLSSTPSPLAPLLRQPPVTDSKAPLLKSGSGWSWGNAVRPLALGSLRLTSARESISHSHSHRNPALSVSTTGLRARTFREAGNVAGSVSGADVLRARTFREGGSGADVLLPGFQPNSAAELLSVYRRSASTQRTSAPVSLRSSHAMYPTSFAAAMAATAPNNAAPHTSFNLPSTTTITAAPVETTQLEPETTATVQPGFMFPTQVPCEVNGSGGSPDAVPRRRSRLAGLQGSHGDLTMPLLQQGAAEAPSSPKWPPPAAAAPGLSDSRQDHQQFQDVAGDAVPTLARDLMPQITFKSGVAVAPAPGGIPMPRATDDTLDTATTTTNHHSPTATGMPEGTGRASAAPPHAAWLPKDSDVRQPMDNVLFTGGAYAGDGTEDAAAETAPLIPPSSAAEEDLSLGQQQGRARQHNPALVAMRELLKGVHQVAGGYACIARATLGLITSLLRLPFWLLLGTAG